MGSICKEILTSAGAMKSGLPFGTLVPCTRDWYLGS
jgi:hypothetical protein